MKLLNNVIILFLLIDYDLSVGLNRAIWLKEIIDQTNSI